MTNYTKLLIPLVVSITLFSCKKNALMEPDPMSALSDLQHFVYKVEAKYKREAGRNDIDLHFITANAGEIRIELTYKKPGDQDLALSIAEAAANMTKRLILEEETLKDKNIRITTQTKLRETTKK